MRNYIYILLLLFSVNGIAQTGIGTTTPHASAKLDVSATNKGFLPPRISLTGISDVATIPSPATGLLVYCKGDAGLAPGYYYWNGTTWVQIAGGLVIDNSKSASFQLDATNNNKLFFINSASAVTVTVPSLLVGFSCQFIQLGAGTITIMGSGTTINSANGFTSRAVNSVIGLVMNGATTGYVFGDTIF